MTVTQSDRRRAAEAHERQTAAQELLEARVLVPEWALAKFLDFCQEELDQVPQLTRAGTTQQLETQSVQEILAEVRKPRRPAHPGRA